MRKKTFYLSSTDAVEFTKELVQHLSVENAQIRKVLRIVHDYQDNLVLEIFVDGDWNYVAAVAEKARTDTIDVAVEASDRVDATREFLDRLEAAKQAENEAAAKVLKKRAKRAAKKRSRS